MYRKVMGISDELMWRYYELLTDKSLEEIAELRASNRPMEQKMRLAHMIVRDFHSEDAALKAAADFDREVRQHDVPQDIETVEYPSGTVNVAKMLQAAGLAPSRSEAERLLKSGAVEIDGNRQAALAMDLAAGDSRTIRAGKKWKRVRGT
jgi:tyrosyl-tRNA synthetase